MTAVTRVGAPEAPFTRLFPAQPHPGPAWGMTQSKPGQEPRPEGYDPAEQSPAEGQSHPVPPQDRGKNPGIDPADKAPAEGARDE